MSERCPNRYLSYATWRLRVLRNLFFQTEGRPCPHSQRRSFTNGSPTSQPRVSISTKRSQSPQAENENTADLLDALSNVSASLSNAGPSTAKGSLKISPVCPPFPDQPKPYGPHYRPSHYLPASPYLRLRSAHGPKEKKRMKPRAEKFAKRRLQNNPWARALASPIRMCAATGVRLPVELLEPCGLVKNPADGKPWLLPATFIDDGDGKAAETSSTHSVENEQLKDAASNTIGEETVRIEQDLDHYESRQDGAIAESSTTPPNLSVALPKIYTLPSAALLTHLSNRFHNSPRTRKGRGNSPVTRLLPWRWKDNRYLSPQELRDIVWREDMAVFVRDLYRKRCVEELVGACKGRGGQGKGRGEHWGVLGVKGAVDVVDGKAVVMGEEIRGIGAGALLWLGESKTVGKRDGVDVDGEAAAVAAEEPQTLEQANTEYPDGPPEMLSLQHQMRNVPVFGLPRLLGDEHVAELRERHKSFRGQWAILRAKKEGNVSALLCLWKLKGYVSTGPLTRGIGDQAR